MRVAVDARPIIKGKLTGMGVYTLNLIKSLAAAVKDEEKLSLFYPAPFFSKKRLPFSFSRKVVSRRPPVSGRLFGSILRKGGWADYFLFQDSSLILTSDPLFPPRLRIKTVHFLADVIPLVKEEFYDSRQISAFRNKIDFLLRTTRGVIVPSKNTLDDLKRLYPSFPKPIRVVPLGIEVDKGPCAGKPEECRAGYGADRYILSVGTLEKRKNFEILLRAYAKLGERDHMLVLAGDKIPGWESLRQLARKLRIDARVVFTGYVSREELNLLYRRASIFVYPSIYEGYGIPPLEAMAWEVPVIVSSSSSLPEVTAGGAVSFRDADDLSEKMRDLLRNRELREKMISRGLERVNELSLQKMGSATLDFCREIIAEKS